jgi:hypothetical protein
MPRRSITVRRVNSLGVSTRRAASAERGTIVRSHASFVRVKYSG